MKILVINAGSSSLKYQLMNMQDESIIAKGNCERIGIDGKITHKLADGTTIKENADFPTHKEAFFNLVEKLTKGEHAVLKSLEEIAAIGHRIVQGGKYFSKSVLVTEEVLNTIEHISDLAPLHNPAHLLAIRACLQVFDPSVPQVVVFDTAFHQTMPPKAYMFGVPYEYYDKYEVRKYGFHGTSHRYVSSKLGELIGSDMSDKKIVTCHLGNGASICAIDGGKCVDTTMGFTPLDGLLMGTRCGAVDPSVVLYIMKNEGLTPDEMNDLLNKKSGFIGLCGLSDSRDLLAAAASGDKKARLVLDMFRYQVKRYIGSYAAVMNGLDAIVFTGGIGENSEEMRQEVCEELDFIGVKIDQKVNLELNHNQGKISTSDSKVDIWIIPTNEELLIARDTKELITQ